MIALVCGNEDFDGEEVGELSVVELHRLRSYAGYSSRSIHWSNLDSRPAQMLKLPCLMFVDVYNLR